MLTDSRRNISPSINPQAKEKVLSATYRYQFDGFANALPVSPACCGTMAVDIKPTEHKDGVPSFEIETWRAWGRVLKMSISNCNSKCLSTPFNSPALMI